MQEQEGRLYKWLFQCQEQAHTSWKEHLLAFPSAATVFIAQIEDDLVQWQASTGEVTWLPYDPEVELYPPQSESEFTYRTVKAGQHLYLIVAEEDHLADIWADIEKAMPGANEIATRELLTLLQLESLLDLMQDAVLLETRDRKIAYVNMAFCSLFSIPLAPSELIGWDCVSALDQAKHLFTDPQEFVARIEVLLRQNDEVRNDRLIMTNGKVLDRDYRPIQANGEDFGRLWVYRDISVIIKQERLSQIQENKYQRVLENLDVGIMEVDNEGIITKVFSKFCQLVGYTEEELIGKDPLVVFDNPEMQKRRVDFQENAILRTQGLSSVYEMPLRKKDGSIIWLQISGTPIFNENNDIIGSLGLHFDITERKRRQDELIKAKNEADIANQAKEKFMSNLSHEMLTPMNGVMGFLNLLHEQDDIPDNQRYYLNAIQNAADNLLVLLEDLLDFSRIEGSAIKFNRRVFNVSRSIHNFCSMFEQQLEENNNQLFVEIDPKLPYKLAGDPLRIGQLVKHLTSNAIKFTENGQIYVRLIEKQRHEESVEVVLEVEDNGMGIPEEEHQKIFERFYRAERFDNRLTSGTGIGLSIVNQIAQQMGGTIDLDSKPGRGSIFRIHFQLDIADDQKISRLLEQFGAQLGQLPILVAEDNTINQLLIDEHLKNWKIPHKIVDNGAAVIEQLAASPFHLVLMDVQMPKMSGIEATTLIRQSNSYYKDIPIIALTAYALSEDEQRCLEAGMNDYVSKPFNPYQLLVKVIEWGLQETIVRQSDTSTVDKDSVSQVTWQTIDLTQLEQFTRGNEALKKKLIQTMIDQEKEILIDIQTFEAVKNWEELFKLMHRLKPNVELLGMVKLIPLVGDLTERFRYQDNLDEAPQLLHQFQEDFKQAVAELKLVIA